MAATLQFFMTPEDEQAFLRQIGGRAYDVYPEVIDVGYAPFTASADTWDQLVEPAYYLHLAEAGDAFTRTLRRGPNAGRLEIDEVASPVLHFERSLMEEEELRSGRIWAELVAVGDGKHRERKAGILQIAYEEIRTYFKKRYVHSDPTGYFIGPDAARKARERLLLREAGRKGKRVLPHR